MKNLKKHVKAVACLLLVAILVLSLASCGSSTPQAEDASGSNWSYTKADKTLRISGVGEMASFGNAESVEWSSVRASVEKIVVNEGITSVGNYAFYGMTALTDVTLPASLVSIGEYAFGYGSALKNVNIPTGVTSIGKGAFEGCGALQSIYVPASVTTIGARAFAYCYSMQSAMITGLPARIESETFKNCKALERLTFRTDLSAEIAPDAFVGAKLNYDTATKTDSVDGSSVITVHYVGTPEPIADQGGSVPYGQGYTYNSPAIDGYTADALTVTGTADGINRTITVTYTKNEVAEAPAETPAPEEEPDEPVGAGTIIAIVVMVLVLVGIGVGAFLLIRSDKKTAGKNTTTVRKNQNDKKKNRK